MPAEDEEIRSHGSEAAGMAALAGLLTVLLKRA
jgi:hypothetical protein